MKTFQALAIILLSSLPVGQARAQASADAASSVDAASAQADELYKQANEAYSAGQQEKALDLYRKAYALKPTHDIAANMARTEIRLGMLAEAASHLDYAISHLPPTGATKHAAALARMQKSMAELRGKVGTVLLSVKNEGAIVRLNGGTVGVAPLQKEVFVEADKETVLEARSEGCRPAERRVRVEAGQRIEVELAPDCTPEAAAPTPLTSAPATTAPPPPPPAAPEPGGPDMLWIGVGAGLTAVSLGAGVALTVVSNGQASNADDAAAKLSPGACKTPSSECTAIDDDLAARDTTAVGAAVAYSLAAAFAGLTVTYFLLEPTADSATSLRVAPTSQGWGLTLDGTF